MKHLYTSLYNIKEIKRIFMARARVYCAKILGLKGGYKCLFGKGVVIERPWKVEIGGRCVFQPFVWLNVASDSAELSIGEYTFIGRGTQIEVAREVKIGKNVLIAPGVFITDHDHGMNKDRPMWTQPTHIKPVIIEDDVWIGANCVICKGVQIGKGSVIGAGAVVTHNIEAYSVAVGIPAHTNGKRA